MVAFKKLVELGDGKINVKYHLQLTRMVLTRIVSTN